MENKELLVQFLSEYEICIQNKHIKEKRMAAINRELRPRVNGYGQVHKRSNQTVGIAIILDDIRKSIEEQQENAGKKLVRIMDVINYLPEGSRERQILELKYIDCKSWPQIGREIYLSKTPCINRRDKAIELLLKNERVQKILKEYRDELEGKVSTF